MKSTFQNKSKSLTLLKRGLIILLKIIVACSIIYYFRQPDDPVEHFDVPALSRAWNYPVEVHDVLTREGYIIQLFRIQMKNQKTIQPLSKRPILLLHGLNCDANIWIGNQENLTLAFRLANEDYDVWMPNDRGTIYSKRHKTLDPVNDKEKYWNYSWDQTALEDLPQVMEYIGNLVKSKMHVLTFSLGLSQILAALAEENKVVEKWIFNKVFSFGGTTFLYHNKAKTIWLAKHLYVFEIMEKLGIYEYSDPLRVIYYWSKYFPYTMKYILMLLTDDYNSPLDTNRIVLFMRYFPSGISVRSYQHCMQFARENVFRKFNFGSKQLNQLHYGQDVAPNYDLTKIKHELHLFYGENDLFSSIEDAKTLINRLTNAKVHYYQTQFGHISFILSNNTDHIQTVLKEIDKDYSNPQK